MGLKVPANVISEMEELVKTGDENLDKRRITFCNHAGRPTTLTDDKLIVALAALSDDDDEEFCQNVLAVEKGEYEIAA